MIADLAGTDSSPTLRKDPAHVGLAGGHAKAVRERILSLANTPSRVLDIGGEDGMLAQELAARGCQVVGIAPDPDQFPRSGERFDAALLIDLLGRVPDPESLLVSVRRAVQSRGRLVATVPDAAHERVRAALAKGADPYDPNGPLDRGQLRLFTRDSLIATIEAAGFAIGLVEPIDRAGWLVEAHALPADDLRWVQDRLREAAQARGQAEHRAGEIERLHAEALLMLDAAHARSRDLARRLQSGRSMLKETHAQLLKQDEEHRATAREILDARDAAESRLKAGETHLAALREALEAWHARSEAEFEESKKALVAGRDSAFEHALAAESRCRSLEMRFEHILMESPRRILRKLKRWTRSHGK